MVYTKVTLFYGLRMNVQTGVPEESELIEDALSEKYKKKGLKVYRYPCCSDLSYKGFIIGKPLKSFERTYPHGNEDCNKCERYTMCPSCLGTTTNGYYDVDHILNNHVTTETEEIDPEMSAKIAKILFVKPENLKVYVTLDDCLSCT